MMDFNTLKALKLAYIGVCIQTLKLFYQALCSFEIVETKILFFCICNFNFDL